MDHLLKSSLVNCLNGWSVGWLVGFDRYTTAWTQVRGNQGVGTVFRPTSLGANLVPLHPTVRTGVQYPQLLKWPLPEEYSLSIRAQGRFLSDVNGY
jgi:hypothetical protein